jgi:long-subunit fatty acid transport protein
MKRITLFSISLLLYGLAMAGGIVTNTNQSAMFTRLQARDATLGIDAVYYNPAGLTLLPNDGLFISLSNQTLMQTRTITSNDTLLNRSEYTGDVSAPFFPGFYAVYKKGKFAASLGFNRIGGDGGGIYDKGLPSFEYDMSDLVPVIQAQGQPVTNYRVDAHFEGTSTYFGYQANVSYKINDIISVALGGRFVTAKETYTGYLRDAEIELGGTYMSASGYFTTGANAVNSISAGIQSIINMNAAFSSMTFADAETAGVPHDQIVLLTDGLTAAGIDPSALTLAQAQGACQQLGIVLTQKSKLLSNQEVDMEKKATGFTPIISVNIALGDKVNLALKYEHSTKLEFTNNTTKDVTIGYIGLTDSITMFPDGEKTRLDIPAQLVAGLTYKPFNKLLLSTGFHYYFDKNADYGRKLKGYNAVLDMDTSRLVDNSEVLENTFEFALGAEYEVCKKISVSAGWLYIHSGAQEDYETDLSYHIGSNTIGGGLVYRICPMIELNLAGSYSIYPEGERTFDHHMIRNPVPIPVKETYDKELWIFAIGLNFNLGASKK